MRALEFITGHVRFITRLILTNSNWKPPKCELPIMFLASNSVHNHEGQKYLCPCHNSKNFEQIHWNQIFCRMYGLAVMLSISRLTTSKTINKIWSHCVNDRKKSLRRFAAIWRQNVNEFTVLASSILHSTYPGYLLVCKSFLKIFTQKTLIYALSKWFILSSDKGSFTNYVYKKRWVGSSKNVNFVR